MKLKLPLLTLLFALFVVSAASVFTLSAQAQQVPCAANACVPETAPDWQQAMALFKEMKYGEAIPLLEKVLAAFPKDAVAHERFATCLQFHAGTLTDPEQRRAERIRARNEYLRAKELGDNSDRVKVMLLGIPEDGHDPNFSHNAEVDSWMKKGEAAYSANKFDEAIDAYGRALALDPHLYQAALFIGDMHFNKGEYALAGEWFLQATQIEPLQETAYRYWGDALLKQGRYADAREKFINAVICSPYDQHPWVGVNNFLRAVNKPAVFRHIKPPVTLDVTGVKDGHISTANLRIPPNMPMDDGSAAWLGYVMARNSWQNGKFAQEYPNEKEYRHSLKEEAFLLSTVTSVALKGLQPGKKLNPDLEFLASLQKQGLLEPYILINAADEGIVKDYPAYRKEHRDLLVRYLSDVVLPTAPADRQ